MLFIFASGDAGAANRWAHLRFGVPLPPNGLAPVEANAEKGVAPQNPAFFTTGARPVGS